MILLNSIQSIDSYCLDAYCLDAYKLDGSKLGMSIGGWVLEFDGTDDYVNIGSYLFGSNNTFTIELWLEPKVADDGIVFSNGLSTDKNRIFLRIDTDKKLVFYTNDSSTNYSVISDSTVVLNKFIHLAIVRSGTTGKIYINGVMDKSGTVAEGSVDDGRDWHIGTRSDGTYPYACSIKNFRIWNIERSEQDIKNDMFKKLKGDESGLVCNFPMDEGSGNIVTDLVSGNQKLINGATWKYV